MFLFTTPPNGPREPGPAAGARAAAGGPVIEAIRDGARSTGAGFDYLLATAQRESRLDPSAKASTSSATGLFQFIEQTWLGVMKAAGPKLGYEAHAAAITARPDGSYTVADPAARQAILDLRRDPQASAALAGALTQRNREALVATLGRAPTDGDLYVAHVLGAQGAAALIGTAQASPSRVAALDMPEAAAANRGLFYDRAGRPRGAAELYAHLSAKVTGGLVPAADALAAAEVPTAYAALGDGLRSLFQTDRRQGAISEGVARLWQSHGTRSPPAATGPAYFPRSDAADETVVAPSAPEPGVAAPAARPAATEARLIPLPPRRPTGLDGGARTAAQTAATASAFAHIPLRLRDGP